MDEFIGMSRDEYARKAAKSFRGSIWKRPSDEYIPGPKSITLSHHFDLSKAKREDRLSLDDKAFFLTGVRANVLFPEPNKLASSMGEVLFELVPEPRNPHDTNAIAVDYLGKRAGYVNASTAMYYQWVIRILNSRGIRCLVAAKVDWPYSTWIALPTLDQLFRTVGAREEFVQEYLDLWLELPDKLVREVEEKRFNFTEPILRRIWSHRQKAPHLFPGKFSGESLGIGWEEARRELRRRWLQVEDRKRDERDQAICRLYAENQCSMAEIGRKLGISGSTVGKVLKIRGLK